MTNFTIIFTDNKELIFEDVFSYDFEKDYLWIKEQNGTEHYFNNRTIKWIGKTKQGEA